MNKKTKEEKEMKRPDAELAERFGVRPQMAHGEMVSANCDLQVAGRIVQIRGIPVMLDRDLAELYGVDVKRLNEQVKRNAERFPPDFMFQLTKDECLRSQIATLNMERGRHLKYYPYVFTEGGIAMLSGVLRSAVRRGCRRHGRTATDLGRISQGHHEIRRAKFTAYTRGL